MTWPRILFARKLVVSLLVRLENFSLNLARDEVYFVVSLFSEILFGIIESRPNCVIAKTSVGSLRYLFRGNGGGTRLGLNHKVSMLVAIISLPRLLKNSYVIPLESLVIGTRPRVIYR